MSAVDIEATWVRIETWLGARAPEVLAALNGGATEAQLAEAERELGVTFPDDLRASYLRHNGQHEENFGFIGGTEALDLAGMLSEWRIWKELLDDGTFEGNESDPNGPIRNDWWNARWIPLTRDGSGNNACLDLDPAEGGRVGQVITMWHDDSVRDILAPTYGDWLAGFADELEAGEWTTHRLYDGLVLTEDAEAEDATE